MVCSTSGTNGSRYAEEERRKKKFLLRDEAEGGFNPPPPTEKKWWERHGRRLIRGQLQRQHPASEVRPSPLSLSLSLSVLRYSVIVGWPASPATHLGIEPLVRHRPRSQDGRFIDRARPQQPQPEQQQQQQQQQQQREKKKKQNKTRASRFTSPGRYGTRRFAAPAEEPTRNDAGVTETTTAAKKKTKQKRNAEMSRFGASVAASVAASQRRALPPPRSGGGVGRRKRSEAAIKINKRTRLSSVRRPGACLITWSGPQLLWTLCAQFIPPQRPGGILENVSAPPNGCCVLSLSLSSSSSQTYIHRQYVKAEESNRGPARWSLVEERERETKKEHFLLIFWGAKFGLNTKKNQTPSTDGRARFVGEGRYLLAHHRHHLTTCNSPPPHFTKKKRTRREEVQSKWLPR